MSATWVSGGPSHGRERSQHAPTVDVPTHTCNATTPPHDRADLPHSLVALVAYDAAHSRTQQLGDGLVRIPGGQRRRDRGGGQPERRGQPRHKQGLQVRLGSHGES